MVDSLRTILRGRVYLVGVGNRMRGDDGAGCWLIERVAGQIAVPCLDAGVAPENRLEEVLRAAPDTVLLIDALDFGADPGECCLVESDHLQGSGVSTHALSLDAAAAYWKARAAVQVLVLGIQPAFTGWHPWLSPAVEQALAILVAALQACWPRETAGGESESGASDRVG